MKRNSRKCVDRQINGVSLSIYRPVCRISMHLDTCNLALFKVPYKSAVCANLYDVKVIKNKKLANIAQYLTRRNITKMSQPHTQDPS